MGSSSEGSDFYREYVLADARRDKSEKAPAPHRRRHSTNLTSGIRWLQPTVAEDTVLPTGGGKTFTAGHFICRNPLSDGFKVLWLAHTHHLLEQAFFSFADLVGLIAEPKSRLNVRVVSGTIGHFPVHSIKASDDVVITSLQTATNAVNNRHKQLDAFLNAAEGNLFVVFDEAHHSPAPSYRNLLASVRDRCPRMYLMGLTATPTHSEAKKRGWLEKLFPQGLIYQVSPTACWQPTPVRISHVLSVRCEYWPSDDFGGAAVGKTLMADGILARPVFEEAQTTFNPDFDEREYEKWVGITATCPKTLSTILQPAKNEMITSLVVTLATGSGTARRSFS